MLVISSSDVIKILLCLKLFNCTARPRDCLCCRQTTASFQYPHCYSVWQNMIKCAPMYVIICCMPKIPRCPFASDRILQYASQNDFLAVPTNSPRYNRGSVTSTEAVTEHRQISAASQKSYFPKSANCKGMYEQKAQVTAKWHDGVVRPKYAFCKKHYVHYVHLT